MAYLFPHLALDIPRHIHRNRCLNICNTFLLQDDHVTLIIKLFFLSSVFFTVEIFRHLPLNRKVRWGTLDDFTTSFLHFSLFSTALWNFANSSPIHSLMLSSHLFLCLPCLLPPFTVPCKMVLVRPDERETCTYHFSLRPITMVRRSSCGSIACWILAQTSSIVKWSLYEMCSVLR